MLVPRAIGANRPSIIDPAIESPLCLEETNLTRFYAHIRIMEQDMTDLPMPKSISLNAGGPVDWV